MVTKISDEGLDYRKADEQRLDFEVRERWVIFPHFHTAVPHLPTVSYRPFRGIYPVTQTPKVVSFAYAVSTPVSKLYTYIFGKS